MKFYKKAASFSFLLVSGLLLTTHAKAYYRTWGDDEAFYGTTDPKTGYFSIKGFYSSVEVDDIENSSGSFPVTYCYDIADSDSDPEQTGIDQKVQDGIYVLVPCGSPPEEEEPYSWEVDAAYGEDFGDFAPHKPSFSEDTFGISVAGGIYLHAFNSNIRAEIEYTSRSDIPYDVDPIYSDKVFFEAPGVEQKLNVNMQSEISSTNYMMNFYYDIANSEGTFGSTVIPYIGIGFGIARNEVKMRILDDYNEWLFSPIGVDGNIVVDTNDLDSDGDLKEAAYVYYDAYSKEKYSFSYSLMAGLNFMLSDIYSIDAGVRYMDLGKLEWAFDSYTVTKNPNTENETTETVESKSKKSMLTSENFTATEFLLGLRITF